jgi:hypothetical protein
MRRSVSLLRIRHAGSLADSPILLEVGFSMAMYVLIPGAASSPWYWHLLEAELTQRGHDVAVVDIPCDDESAGLAEYTAQWWSRSVTTPT